jgi:hypothetical protein
MLLYPTNQPTNQPGATINQPTISGALAPLVTDIKIQRTSKYNYIAGTEVETVCVVD